MSVASLGGRPNHRVSSYVLSHVENASSDRVRAARLCMYVCPSRRIVLCIVRRRDPQLSPCRGVCDARADVRLGPEIVLRSVRQHTTALSEVIISESGQAAVSDVARVIMPNLVLCASGTKSEEI
jgi:hypothetical protein